MHGVFDDEESRPVERRRDTDRRDTELTLGPLMLLGIFFVLVLLCGLFFGLGYSAGRRHSAEANLPAPQAGADASLPATASPAKPSAAPQNVPQSPERAVVSLSPPGDAAGGQPTNAQTSGSSPSAGSSPSQPSVKPALPPQPTQFQPAPPQSQPAPALPASANRAVPSGAAPSTLMVQIAAVSHTEDADVLVSALRKRGYAVSARRDPADGLLHVRMGPFNSRDEANKWKQKLLNDGYNAVVQP
jgi:cell division septation protein DedD